MKRILLVMISVLLFTLVVSAQPADSPWPQFHGSSRGLSLYDTSKVDGTVLWEFESGDSIESSPAIGADGTIYFGSHDGFVYALSKDGNLKWKFDAGPPSYDKRWNVVKSMMATPAIAKDGTIYAYSSANNVFAINPDGTLKWKFKVKWLNDFWSSPIIGPDGTIYVGSGRPEDRSEFKGGVFAITPQGKEKWFYDTGNGMTMPVAIASNGDVYFGIGIPSENKLNPDTGAIVAVSSQGKKKWQFPVELWVEGPVTIADDGTIYATTKEGDLYALTPEGKEKWMFHTDDGLSAAPAIGADGTIYLGSWDCHLYALSPTGSLKWKYKTPDAFEGITSAPAIGADGTIYVGSNSGLFYAFNPDGTVKWEFTESKNSGITVGPAIGADGTIYIASQNHKLYALGCCGGNEGKKECISGEYKYDMRILDPVSCPKSNFCLRESLDGSECYERGSCSDEYHCNMIIKNLEDSTGQFILKTNTGYHINDIEPGKEVSIGWKSNIKCEYMYIIAPKKMDCGEENKVRTGDEIVYRDLGQGEPRDHTEGDWKEESVDYMKDAERIECGNDVCEEGELETCYDDCSEYIPKEETVCGNGICEEGEKDCHDDCNQKSGFFKGMINWFKSIIS